MICITQILSFYSYFWVLCICRNASNTTAVGLSIGVSPGVNAKLIVKGENTFNSNGVDGIYTTLNSNSNLEINVESDATLKSCENGRDDIRGFFFAPATATFLGTGYTCDPNKVVFVGDGTVVEPKCQACP